MWYLIVSIPDHCCLSYLVKMFKASYKGTLVFTIFVDQPVVYQIILNSYHRFQRIFYKVFVTMINHSHWQPFSLVDRFCFCRGVSSKHLYEVWLKLIHLSFKWTSNTD